MMSKSKAVESLETMHASSVRQAIGLIEETEQLLTATKRCLTGQSPGMPVYLPDVLSKMGGLLAIAGHMGALKEAIRKAQPKRR